MNQQAPKAERSALMMRSVFIGVLAGVIVALGVWAAVAGGGPPGAQRVMATGATEPVEGVGLVVDIAERLPTDFGDFDDAELVRRLIAESMVRDGLELGTSCYEGGASSMSNEVPPFMGVVRIIDGECVLGGFVSRGQALPMLFGPEESRTVPGWQPPWETVPIFDDQGNVIGDMATGSAVYFEDARP